MNENTPPLINKEDIKTVLLEHKEIFSKKERGVTRFALEKIENASRSPHAVVISGLRRVGKSTLLAQTADLLGEANYYYVNFEDERLAGFPAKEANYLYETLCLLFGERKIFLLDEIQNITGWEKFVRRFMDAGFKFYITGSNASLLSRELGTKLTGRHIPIELFPFSFLEYLNFKKQTVGNPVNLTTTEAVKYEALFQEYLTQGGIAEALKYPELPVHTTLYNDVLYRDIASRYQIEETTALKELMFYLMSNIAGLFSYNKLKMFLKLGSVNTVKNFIEYARLSWLFFVVNAYAFSVKKQQIAPKKIYCSDTGLAQAIAFSFSKNKGKYLENAVYLALRRQYEDIYYYKTKAEKEVDFYIPTKQLLIQTSLDINDQAVYEREIGALLLAMDELKIDSGIIISGTGEKQIAINGKKIAIIPASKWLLMGEKQDLIMDNNN
jgi:predicted AAA+ superfamily ATPase